MMYRRHSDRPSVELTVEERRAFAEIAGRLRLELDGLTFDPPLSRRRRASRYVTARCEGPIRCVAQFLARVGHSRLAGPVLTIVGVLSLVLLVQSPVGRNEGMAVMAAVAITVTGASVTMSRLSAARRARSLRPERTRRPSMPRPRPSDGRTPWT